MILPIKRLSNTAFRILRTEGAFALLRSVANTLRAGRNSLGRFQESDIAFQVLGAKNSGGVMIDVGACFGTSLKRFADAGWQVYAFEPDSHNRAQLLERGFGRMSNVMIDRRGVADRPAAAVPLYRSDESAGISGLSAFHPSHVQSELVDVTTLASFSREHDLNSVDFLKIDTEGFDLFVLRGFPWERIQPKLVLCEFEDRKTLPLGYGFHDLAGYLADKGYHLVVSEWYPIERYGIEHSWRRFATYPCDLEDVAAWGNIIAAKESVYRSLIAACELA